MLQFIKQILRNIQEGPATDPYPLRETPAPKRFRGKITIDPEKCLACGLCYHVCAGRAIHIKQDKEKLGFIISVWHNGCALCGMCRHYCPTGAITHTQNWHTAHLQSAKFEESEHHFIPYIYCRECGAPMQMLPPELAAKAYGGMPFNMSKLMRLCPDCRAIATATRLKTGEEKESD